MKKFTKCLAVLSSAIMMLSVGVVHVSAGLENTVYHDTTKTSADGTVILCKTLEQIVYTGIVVTMPDENAPAAEELGIDCKVSEYNAVNYGLADRVLSGDLNGWVFEETVEPAENQYVLDVDDIMDEDEAIEFAKKLVIRGVAEKADVLYEHMVNDTGQMTKGWIGLKFTDSSAAADFSIDKYPEIKDILKYTEYKDIIIYDKSIELKCDSETSKYNNEGIFDYMELSNDIETLNSTMTEKYDEIEEVYPGYVFLDMCAESSAVYSVEPKWGDATNDDVIDLYDAIEISKYIMNISDIDEDTVLLADINRDGKTDLYDAIEVAKCIMEK